MQLTELVSLFNILQIKKIINSVIIKNVITLFVGATLGQLITVLVMPIMSRLYSPDEFGKFAIFLAVSSIISTLVTLRYEINILIPKDLSESESLVLLSVYLAIVLGLIVLLLSYLISDNIKIRIGLATIGWWLQVAIVFGIITAIIVTALAWLNRQEQYSRIAVIKLLQSLIFAVSGVIFGLLKINDGLLIAQLISGILVSVILFINLPKINQINLRELMDLAFKYSTSPKFTLPMALVDTITLQLPVILIGLWFGSEDAGKFSLAWRVLALPSSLIGAAFGQVFFQKFAALWPKASESRSLLIKSWIGMALLGFIPMLIVLLYGEILFEEVFGSNWIEAGIMASYMAPMVYFSFIHSPTSTTSIVLGLQKKISLLSFIVAIYRPLSFYIGFKFGSIYMALVIFSICEILLFLGFQVGMYKKITSQI